MCIASVLGTLLYTPFGKPIWIDEFLHFAFASFDSTEEAWAAIKRSTSGVNHGQTGIYMLINYWALKVWGSDALILRAPSLICTALLYFFAAMTIKIRGYGFIWQIGAVFILFGQSELLYYAGEARPYMPLATAAIGTLAYAVASPDQRATLTIKLTGLFSVILGVLMHPYFSLYWAAIFVFGFWQSWLNQEVKFTLKDLLAYFNIPLCVIGTLIYFYLASQTWLTGSPVFALDPFQFMRRTDIYRLFIYNHTTFLGVHTRGEFFLYLSLTPLVLYLFCPSRLKSLVRPLLPPAVLLWLALGLTFFISLMSYYQNYWILTRQWVASIAIVAVAFAWLMAALFQILERTVPVRFRQGLIALLFLLLTIYCWRASEHNAKVRWASLLDNYGKATVQQFDLKLGALQCPIQPEVWVDLANANINSRSSVSPLFKYYYSGTENPYCAK